MQAFRHIFFAALFAGLLAGGLATAGADAAAHDRAAGHVHADGAAHDHGGWSPADGAERTLYTLLADLLAGVAYALLLVAALALRGGAADWRRGLIWGLAGFAAFVLAPSLGLPPVVPGTESAPVPDRQLWWAATAALTAGGLGLLAFGRNVALAALGAALIVLPHLVGAPQPAEPGSVAPEWLAQRFAVLSTVVNFAFWVVLGTAAGHLYGRPSRA